MLSFSLRRGTFLQVGQGDLSSPDTCWRLLANTFSSFSNFNLLKFKLKFVWFVVRFCFPVKPNWIITNNYLERMTLNYYLKHASGKLSNANWVKKQC